MLLCIHGAGASSGEWLPHLRKLIQTPDQYAGHKLLEACTIQLPGHFCEDHDFDWEWSRMRINQFSKRAFPDQSRLFQSLKHSTQTPLHTRLASKKLTIIGDELGASIALYYALNHPTQVDELILLNCGESFSFLSKIRRHYIQKRIWSLSSEKLQMKLNQSKHTIDERNLYTILMDNPSRKGLTSAYSLMNTYSFSEFFAKTSLNNQLMFSQLPMCIINGQKDWQSSPRNAAKLEQIFGTKNPFFKSQQAALTLGAIPRLSISKHVFKNVGWKCHHILRDTFIETVFNFLEDTQSSYIV